MRPLLRALVATQWTALLLSQLAHSGPVPLHPPLALIHDPGAVLVSVVGSGFGNPASGAKLVVQSGASSIDIASQSGCAPPTSPDQCIAFWTDTWITAKIPVTYGSATVRVVPPSGPPSEDMRAQYWRYDYFATNSGAAQTSGNPAPHTVAIAPPELDPDRNVWVGEEFHRAFKHWNPIVGGVVKDTILHPTPLPFAYSYCPGEVCTDLSVDFAQSREILTDPYGRTWMNETGSPPYEGPLPNHSRIFMFDGGVSRVYNFPGSHNQLLGMAYEQNYAPGRDRIWYTVQRRAVDYVLIHPARIGWFDVDAPGPCVSGQCRFGTPGACTDDEDCTLWHDGTTPFDDVAACVRTCNDQNFPGETCASDSDCTPRCIDGECLFGTPGSCTTDGDCAAQCAPPNCTSGRDGLCFLHEHCTPSCSPSRTCSDALDRACHIDADCYESTIVCPWDDASPTCRFHEYALSDTLAIPGYLARGRTTAGAYDGSLWATGYWDSGSGRLHRLNPATGVVTTFPLGDDPSRSNRPGWIFGGSPFDLAIADDGDVIVNEYSDTQINRLERSRIDTDPSCQTLDGSGHNPCLTTLSVPSHATGYDQHSIDLGPREVVWFGTAGGHFDQNSRATIGFVKPDWSAIALFPPLSLYPFSGDGACGPPPPAFQAFVGAGIAVDTATEDVWFADYCRKRLGRFIPHTTNLALMRPATLFGGTWCNGAGHCGPPEAAVDGNVDGNFAHDSVAHTFGTVQPYLEVDLGSLQQIEAVELWNRTDCCSNRLANFYLFVSDVPFTSDNPATVAATPGVQAQYQSAAVGVTTTKTVNRLGRYVRVQLTGSAEPLQLAEIIVLGHQPVNLALGRSATLYGGTWCNAAGHCGPPEAAVDGNVDGNFAHDSVAHTFGKVQPYWEVDLGSVQEIDGIELWNRTDCCGYRLANFYVFVSDAPFTSNNPATVAAAPGVQVHYQSAAAGVTTVKTVNRSGRYVRVQLAGTTEPLQLAEVVVLGRR